MGGWSDAEPPSRGGWVVGRDGYLKYRVHLGKRTGPREREREANRASVGFLFPHAHIGVIDVQISFSFQALFMTD